MRLLSCQPLIVLLFWTVAACAQQSSHLLVDSGFPANEQYQPFWIDNERVIFKGYAPGSYSREMHGIDPGQARAQGYENGMRTGYFLWHTKTGKVEPYKDKVTGLCVEGDEIVYQSIPQKAGDKVVVWRGKAGVERPTAENPAPSNSISEHGNCWDIFPDRTQAQRGRHVLRLRPGSGYLDLGPANPPIDMAAPVLYYRKDDTKPIRLPIAVAKLTNGGYVRFIAHEQRHLIVGGSGDLSKVPEAWFLGADGALSEVILPPGPWRTVRLYRVKGGFFLSSTYTEGKKLSDPGGAYLIPDGKWWELLFTGIKNRGGVSPDGCKVALTVAPTERANLDSFAEWKAGRPGEKTMRMIDLCKGAKQ